MQSCNFKLLSNYLKESKGGFYMSVNSYLENLGSNLILTSSEKENIQKSINHLKECLKYYFGSEVNDQFVFGSYTRNTILPRSYDSKSDIDYMIVFNNTNSFKPQTFLNKLKDFAKLYYPNSIIHQDSPTIVLELNHIKFDLVPAYYDFIWYKIPDGQGGWMITTPNDINDLLVKSNMNNNSKIKPIIRLIKNWNINVAGRIYESYTLEKKIVSNLGSEYYFCTSYTDYLIKIFEKLRNSYYFPCPESNKINNAIQKIKDSLNYERQGQCNKALEQIKLVFPED